MIKVSLFYPNQEGKKFDMDYYLNSHIPMSKEKLGDAVKGLSVEQGISGADPASPATYIVMVHWLFESVERFQSAFGPHAETLKADIPNYTDIKPFLQISEVIL